MGNTTRVFPQLQMKTHMPFCNGTHLLFCGSEKPVNREFDNSGTVFRRIKRDASLQDHFGGLPKSSHVTYREWKLFWCTLANPTPARLETGMPDAIECSPAMYSDAGKVYASFIGGTITPRGVVYHLYSMSGSALDKLSAATRVLPTSTPIGFVNSKYICLGRGQTIQPIEKSTQKTSDLETSLAKCFE